VVLLVGGAKVGAKLYVLGVDHRAAGESNKLANNADGSAGVNVVQAPTGELAGYVNGVIMHAEPIAAGAYLKANDRSTGAVPRAVALIMIGLKGGCSGGTLNQKSV